MNKSKDLIIIIFIIIFSLVWTRIVIKPEHEKEEITKQKAKLETIIQDLQNDKVDLKNTVLKLQEEVQSKQELIDVQKKRTVVSPTRERSNRTNIFMATAYDLSFASCGKEPSHPQCGISASGVDLKGKSLDDRFIAVDPKVIKLGSVVYIKFFEPYQHLTGYYTAVDTGGAIKGNKVDIFFGSGDVSQAVKNFGRRQVRITY